MIIPEPVYSIIGVDLITTEMINSMSVHLVVGIDDFRVSNDGLLKVIKFMRSDCNPFLRLQWYGCDEIKELLDNDPNWESPNP